VLLCHPEGRNLSQVRDTTEKFFSRPEFTVFEFTVVVLTQERTTQQPLTRDAKGNWAGKRSLDNKED